MDRRNFLKRLGGTIGAALIGVNLLEKETPWSSPSSLRIVTLDSLGSSVSTCDVCPLKAKNKCMCLCRLGRKQNPENIEKYERWVVTQYDSTTKVATVSETFPKHIGNGVYEFNVQTLEEQNAKKS